MQASAVAVDRGNDDEAIRLAQVLRVLLHHQGNSRALLSQLGLLETLPFVDTCRYRDAINARAEEAARSMEPKGMTVVSQTPSDAGLVLPGLHPVTDEPAWIAPLAAVQDVPRPFPEWWTAPGIETSAGSTFSRFDLVRIAANQDGGSHVDPAIDEDYDAFGRDFLGIEHSVVDDNGMESFVPMRGNVVAGCIRQIAYEVLETLRRAELDYLAPIAPIVVAPRLLPYGLISPTVFGIPLQPDEQRPPPPED